MTRTIDCRGLDCPAPVLKARSVIEEMDPDRIRVIVDNDAAVENVTRFLDYQGYEVCVDSDGISSTVSGVRAPGKNQISGSVTKGNIAFAVGHPESTGQRKIVILIGSQEIGSGDSGLGRKLMINYIKTLKEMGRELWQMIFLNHGVRLATEDSEVLEDLKALEADGTRILVCGTCLTYLGLMEKKAVGQTTNMLDVVTAMQLSDKVISL